MCYLALSYFLMLVNQAPNLLRGVKGQGGLEVAFLSAVYLSYSLIYLSPLLILVPWAGLARAEGPGWRAALAKVLPLVDPAPRAGGQEPER